MCITTETPDAQNLELFSVPGMFFLNLFENLPYTSEKFTSTLSKTFPFSNILNSPPPSFFLSSKPSFFLKILFLDSIISISLQITSCKILNQFLAKSFF